MSYDIKNQRPTESLSAYTLRKFVVRNCQHSSIVELLDLADNLHDMIRVRRGEIGGGPANDLTLIEDGVEAGVVLID